MLAKKWISQLTHVSEAAWNLNFFFEVIFLPTQQRESTKQMKHRLSSKISSRKRCRVLALSPQVSEMSQVPAHHLEWCHSSRYYGISASSFCHPCSETIPGHFSTTDNVQIWQHYKTTWQTKWHVLWRNVPQLHFLNLTLKLKIYKK